MEMQTKAKDAVAGRGTEGRTVRLVRCLFHVCLLHIRMKVTKRR